MAKCKKCECEVGDDYISALEMDMIIFWGCDECKKKYHKLFKEQNENPQPFIPKKDK